MPPPAGGGIHKGSRVAAKPWAALLALLADEQAPPDEAPLGLTGAGSGAGVGCGVQGVGALKGEPRPAVRTEDWRQADPVDVQPCGRSCRVVGHAIPSTRPMAAESDMRSQSATPAVHDTWTIAAPMVVEDWGFLAEAAAITARASASMSVPFEVDGEAAVLP
jgi:hypothetical protein